MTEKEKENRVSMLQYLNTAGITIVLGISVMMTTIMMKVKDSNETLTIEITKMKTIQDQQVEQLKSLSSRTYVLELESPTLLKNWVEDNYIRKPQK